MKSEDQNIDVGDEKRFDSLTKLYKDIKDFKNNKSANILFNFYVDKFKVCREGNEEDSHLHQKIQLKQVTWDEDYELQLNLSSTAVCTYALLQYSDIWDERDKEKLGNVIDYYEFIMYGLKTCLKGLVKFLSAIKNLWAGNG